jgi:hypothetical protein
MFADQILNDPRHLAARNALVAIQQQNRDIKQLERSINELQQMFLDMSTVVDVQGEMLEQIGINVNQAVVSSGISVNALEVAERSNKARKRVSDPILSPSSTSSLLIPNPLLSYSCSCSCSFSFLLSFSFFLPLHSLFPQVLSLHFSSTSHPPPDPYPHPYYLLLENAHLLDSWCIPFDIDWTWSRSGVNQRRCIKRNKVVVVLLSKTPRGCFCFCLCFCFCFCFCSCSFPSIPCYSPSVGSLLLFW